mgnify:FL=1
MHVSERQPYAGKLVFAAFSGSHQDAIAKGMKYRKEHNDPYWTCPYLYINPHDVGRTYDADVIRINSQSGKGGVAYIMETAYGIDMPKAMREDFSYFVKDVSDHKHQELKPDEIFNLFKDHYVDKSLPIELQDTLFRKKDGKWQGKVLVRAAGRDVILEGAGNGQLDAVKDALCRAFHFTVTDLTYSEHDLDRVAESRGIAYFGITDEKGVTTWGAGVDTDTMTLPSSLHQCLNRRKDAKDHVYGAGLISSEEAVNAFHQAASAR